MIILWMRLTVQMRSLERVLLILKDSEQLDLVLLKREIQSPRKAIE